MTQKKTDEKLPPNEQLHDQNYRFRKGNPGGPGRKKGQRRLLDELKKVLAEPANSGELDSICDALEIPADVKAELELASDRLSVLARVIVNQALNGKWLNTLLDRIEPAPRQVELSGRGGGPVRTANMQLTAQIKPETAEAEYFGMLPGLEQSADEEDDQTPE